jgi:ATP-dependent Clp protease ATP-binding subunit ClpA
MSTMDERKFRDLYDTQCEVIDAIAEALHAHGLPNDVVIERAREMTIRAHSAERQRDSARRLVDIMRDHHDREMRELRAELDVARSRLMTVTSERDTLRRAEDAERAYRERQNAQTLAEVKALGAKLRGES